MSGGCLGSSEPSTTINSFHFKIHRFIGFPPRHLEGLLCWMQQCFILTKTTSLTYLGVALGHGLVDCKSTNHGCGYF